MGPVVAVPPSPQPLSHRNGRGALSAERRGQPGTAGGEAPDDTSPCQIAMGEGLFPRNGAENGNAGATGRRPDLPL
jgi:hypothetical protein